MKKIYFLCAGVMVGSASMAQTINHNGHTYQLVEYNEVSWNMAEAETHRLGEGWHLATITSPEEQQVVQELLNGKKKEYWLGAEKDAANNWVWTTDEEFAYNNWGTGEPNNYNSRDEQHIAIWQRIGGKWNDEAYLPHIGGYIVEHDGDDQLATSTDDLSSGNMEVYPNPNTGLFTVNLSTEAKGLIQLNVFNIVGSVVHSENLNSNGSGLRHDLDLTNLTPGTYWVKLSNGQESITKKVVIMQ